MNLKELASPVRIYWNLPHDASELLEILKVCDEIIESKILFLSLHQPAFSDRPSCLNILRRFSGEHMAVHLTLPWNTLTTDFLEGLAGLPIKGLFAEVSSMPDLRAFAERAGSHAKAGLRAGISFDLKQETCRQVPELIAFCLERGIPDILFPIQRLPAGGKVFCLSEEIRKDMDARLRNIDYHKLRITIHDPFLWQVFYPDTEYHEGGCQAANSMLYISPDFKVYPCPAMPLGLGDLRKDSLRTIILSDDRKRLRRFLMSPPDECVPCDQADRCMGGCRGRAFAACGSLNRRDPACQ